MGTFRSIDELIRALDREKVKKLKYPKDQFRLEEATDIRQVVASRNAVWMEPQPSTSSSCR